MKRGPLFGSKPWFPGGAKKAGSRRPCPLSGYLKVFFFSFLRKMPEYRDFWSGMNGSFLCPRPKGWDKPREEFSFFYHGVSKGQSPFEKVKFRPLAGERHF